VADQKESAFSVTFPPGPISPGFMSPSSVQEPTNISSFLTSGPGFGISICASAAAANTNHATKIIPMFFMFFLATSFDFELLITDY
jgi:hypothetical protein